MEGHYGSSSWYTHHLALHSLRKVLDLRHGNPMCQPHKIGMNALERLLRIHTRDIISSSHPSVMREAFRPPWSHICMQMVDVTMYCHTKICLLIPYNQKTQKN